MFHGINDPKIIEALSESGIAYIDKDGSICTSDINAKEVSVLADMLRNSTVAFGGRYLGVYPRIRAVTQSAVTDHIQNSHSSFVSKQKNRGQDSDVGKKLRRLLEEVTVRGASDIHIRNIIGERTEINIRVNGDFIDLRDQTAEYGEEILTYIVMNLAGGSDYSIRGYADHKFTMNLRETEEIDGVEVVVEKESSWRLAQIPIQGGSKVAIRRVNSGGDVAPTMVQLGIPPGHAREIESLMKSGEGIVLITGPTGSGKTTLINSSLQLCPSNRNIHTLEDPVEWGSTARNAVQTQVDESFRNKDGEKTRGFLANSIRLLRQDTDVVFFGEIREEESAGQAMRMAETGQLVLGTLHTNSSISSVSTLVEQMGVTAAKLSSPGVVRALGHQRLVKRLCQSCCLDHERALLLADEHESLRQSILYNDKLGIDLTSVRYRNPKGCDECDGAGEPGRTALFELVIIDRKCRELIGKMDLNGLVDYLESLGWPSIRDHGIHKIVNGEVDVSAVAEKVDGLIPVEVENIYRNVFK
ncbi:GspE/PulE family protein [Vibrio owensii]|uniref:GspE/PulE family protein n=1 Tax=Vibrio owensii TaxID=696485 RepID=UPI0018F205FC|nr:ATPase, T2SS/T4P/T4SS family [Vibrio owensii]